MLFANPQRWQEVKTLSFYLQVEAPAPVPTKQLPLDPSEADFIPCAAQ